MSEQTFEITLERTQGYQFSVDAHQPGVPPWLVDETPPLGEGHGPNPARMLAAAIGHCLSASALFCLGKARVQVSVDVTGGQAHGSPPGASQVEADRRE